MRFMGRSGMGLGGSRIVRTAFAAARQPTKAGHDAVWRRYQQQRAAEQAVPTAPEEAPPESDPVTSDEA